MGLTRCVTKFEYTLYAAVKGLLKRQGLRFQNSYKRSLCDSQNWSSFREQPHRLPSSMDMSLAAEST